MAGTSKRSNEPLGSIKWIASEEGLCFIEEVSK